MRRWLTRAFCIGLGWHMAMSYPKDDSVGALLLSLAVGTFGVLWVAFTAYCAGYIDASESRAADAGATGAGAEG